MIQARPTRSVLMLLGLLGGAALGAAALAAIRPGWLRTGNCRPVSQPEARAEGPVLEEEDAGRVAFV